jgi:hypothetical protein
MLKTSAFQRSYVMFSLQKMPFGFVRNFVRTHLTKIIIICDRLAFFLSFLKFVRNFIFPFLLNGNGGKPRFKKTFRVPTGAYQCILSSFSAQTTGMHFLKKYTNWEENQKIELSPLNNSCLFDYNVIYLDQRICFSRSSQYCPPNVIGT